MDGFLWEGAVLVGELVDKHITAGELGTRDCLEEHREERVNRYKIRMKFDGPPFTVFRKPAGGGPIFGVYNEVVRFQAVGTEDADI